MLIPIFPLATGLNMISSELWETSSEFKRSRVSVPASRLVECEAVTVMIAYRCSTMTDDELKIFYKRSSLGASMTIQIGVD